MTGLVFWGIFGIGFVFGYLLYYAVRHTKEFSIEMLSVAIGAVSSATVIGFLGNYQDWIAPYGLGLLAGFLFYLVLSIILIATGLFEKLANVGILSKTLLGAPRE
jgi:O-antigen/teichoic acid export membrane protein